MLSIIHTKKKCVFSLKTEVTNSMTFKNEKIYSGKFTENPTIFGLNLNEKNEMLMVGYE